MSAPAKQERARLGVEGALGPTGRESDVLGRLRDRGMRGKRFHLPGAREKAFNLAHAVGVSLADLAPTLAYLEGHGLAELSGAAWAMTGPGLAYFLADEARP